MTATMVMSILVLLIGLSIPMGVLFMIDQREWRKCRCGSDSFDESEAARLCMKCGRPW